MVGWPKGKKRPYKTRKAFPERFWEKVDKKGPTECWPWLATKHNRGYGQFFVGTSIPEAHQKKGKMHYATHVMLYLTDGLWDSKAVVMHSCDNPICVNPAHLKRGTHSENIKDCYDKGRHNWNGRY